MWTCGGDSHHAALVKEVQLLCELDCYLVYWSVINMDCWASQGSLHQNCWTPNGSIWDCSIWTSEVSTLAVVWLWWVEFYDWRINPHSLICGIFTALLWEEWECLSSCSYSHNLHLLVWVLFQRYYLRWSWNNWGVFHLADFAVFV